MTLLQGKCGRIQFKIDAKPVIQRTPDSTISTTIRRGVFQSQPDRVLFQVKKMPRIAVGILDASARLVWVARLSDNGTFSACLPHGEYQLHFVISRETELDANILDRLGDEVNGPVFAKPAPRPKLSVAHEPIRLYRNPLLSAVCGGGGAASDDELATFEARTIDVVDGELVVQIAGDASQSDILVVWASFPADNPKPFGHSLVALSAPNDGGLRVGRIPAKYVVGANDHRKLRLDGEFLEKECESLPFVNQKQVDAFFSDHPHVDREKFAWLFDK